LYPNITASFRKDSLFLQDSAAPYEAYIVHQTSVDLHFEVLKYLAYSPDLIPSDYYLFHNLKNRLKGKKFFSTEEATSAVDGWFAAQPKEFLFYRLRKLEQQSRVWSLGRNIQSK
jgi:hypothetical protein